MTMVESIGQVILRDIRSLEHELDGFTNDSQVWELPGSIRNSTGTLVMHLCGNLRHFIGQGIGRSGYARDRDFEFDGRNIPRNDLKQLIADAHSEVAAAFGGLTDDKLLQPYPNAPGGRAMSVGLFLVHLSAHLGYHLGQIDYHRRIVTGNPEAIGTLLTSEIGE